MSMKKIFAILLLCLPMAVMAQPRPEDATDATLTEKIIIIPHIAITSDVPDKAQPLLLDKMKQALLRQGVMDSSDRSRFILTVRSNVLEEGMTETTPAKAYQKISFTFYIGDVDSGILFSSKNLTRKGVGDNKDQAYLNAVKQIQSTDPAFKRLIEEAKIRIVETLKAREDAGEFDKDSYDINWW